MHNKLGCVAQLAGHLTSKSVVLDSIPGLATYFRFSSADSRGAVVSYWRKYVHKVLVNRLGLSLPRKSVVRLTDHPDMTSDVYCGRHVKQQHHNSMRNIVMMKPCFLFWFPPLSRYLHTCHRL